MKKLYLNLNPLALGLCFLLLMGAGPVAAKERVFDRVIVIVNHVAITQNQLELRLQKAVTHQGLQFKNASEREAAKERILEDLIQEALLESKALEMKLEISEGMIDGELDNYLKSRRLTRQGLEMILELQKTTMANFKENIRRRLLRERVILQEVKAQVVMDDEQLRKQYEEEGGWNQKAHARHILIRVSPGAPKSVVETARKRALKLRKQAIQGKNFSDLALKYSEDPSAKSNKGDMGYFHRGQMVKEFSDVAFSIKINRVSQPIRTQFGFHLIQVLDRKQTKQLDFDTIKNQFQKAATDRAYEKEYERYLADLKAKAEIQRMK